MALFLGELTGRFNIRFVKAYSTNIEEGNIHLLIIIDSLKDFRKIAATNWKDVLGLLKIHLKNLSATDRRKIIQLGLDYPPNTRALLGALLELRKNSKETEELFKSLNPKSRFKLGISDEILPNRIKWKIQ